MEGLTRPRARRIGRANVAAEAGKIAKHSGPVAANRARASLSAFYRWAIGEGLCEENPVTGTNKQEESGPRERSLSDAEAAAVWLAAPDNDYGRIVRLILLTGCRRTELGSLQWSEIDKEARTLTLPPSALRTAKPTLCHSATPRLRSLRQSRAERAANMSSARARAVIPAGRNPRPRSIRPPSSKRMDAARSAPHGSHWPRHTRRSAACRRGSPKPSAAETDPHL